VRERLHFVNQLNFQLCVRSKQQQQQQQQQWEEEGNIKVNAGSNKGNDTITPD